MARGSSQATGAATSAQNLSNQSAGQAHDLYGFLAPQLEQQAANPTGYSPTDMAAMDTAAQEGAGGSMAGAVGEGALHNERTKNAGGADAAIAESARDSAAGAAKGALASRFANANLKQENRRSALGGLGSLLGMATGNATNALGIVPNAVNANTNAKAQSWDWAKYLLDPAMAAGGQAGAAYLAG